MADAPKLASTVSAYVKITPSGITANLIQYGTSTITLGHEQALILDPGTYSVDLDGNAFNGSVSVSALEFISMHPHFLRTGVISTTVAYTTYSIFHK